MAVNVANLVGDWQITEQGLIIPPGPFTLPIVDSNPRRYAIGFHYLTTDPVPNGIRITTLAVPGPGTFAGFYPVTGTIYWFDLPKYGIMSSVPWTAIGTVAGLGGQLTIWQIIQNSNLAK